MLEPQEKHKFRTCAYRPREHWLTSRPLQFTNVTRTYDSSWSIEHRSQVLDELMHALKPESDAFAKQNKLSRGKERYHVSKVVGAMVALGWPLLLAKEVPPAKRDYLFVAGGRRR